MASFTVHLLDGAKASKRRAIAFLECTEDAGIDARAVFQRLGNNREREVRSRFDYWIDGNIHDKYFHGWPNSQRYKQCFVFKWRDNNQNHRFYGFLCNPLPAENPSFQLCVLVSHAIKDRWETDERELDGANSLRLNPPVNAAIAKLFSQPKVRVRPWVS